jgi:CheY-like chemotaxis protein
MPEVLPSILVVDDEDGIRLTLRDYLRIKGHEVFVASDGVGAIKILLDQAIDVVITDYRMDIFGGDYWIRFLDRFCGDKRVIISSGFVQLEFKIPFEVIQKPFDYADILQLIQTPRK